MNISVSDILNYAFVISVDEEQYKFFIDRFNDCGLNKPLPRLFKGFCYPNGVHKKARMTKTSHVINCTASHEAIVRMAQSLDWPFVCIFEDDAYPMENDIHDKLNVVLSKIPNDVDLVRFGYNHIVSSCKFNEDFIIPTIVWGSHAYIIFKQYYNEFLHRMSIYMVADMQPISHMKNDNFKILMTKHNYFVQKSKDSNCSNRIHGNIPSQHSITAFSNEK